MSYTFSLSRRSLPVRCLCLLLVVLVLWCFFMVPRAGAVATEAATVAYAGALIGTILVGAGVMFSSHGDMQAVGAAMYKSWIKSSNAIGSKISAIAAWALQHGEAVAKGALRVGKDMYQTVVDAFNAAYSNGNFVTGHGYSELSQFVAVCPFASSVYINKGPGTSGTWSRFTVEFVETVDPGGRIDLVRYSLFGGKWYRYGLASIINSPLAMVRYGWFVAEDDLYCRIIYADSSTQELPVPDFPSDFGYVSDSLPNQIPISGLDLAYPSDNTLVRMPDIPSVDTATGTVTFPSDAAYTKDAVSVPYPVDAEGVKVPDIPYDKVVDQSTGKTLDDADTGTDTKPGEGTGEGTETGSGVSGLIGTIIGLLKNFFDSPSDFKLDMDGFRNLAIADKFPFCIPFDMVDSVKQFAVTAANYQFRIKFDTQYFSVDHTVDLTPIAVPLAFFRYIVCVWFVWVLMSRTHDLMKW